MLKASRLIGSRLNRDEHSVRLPTAIGMEGTHHTYDIKFLSLSDLNDLLHIKIQP